MHVPVLMSQVSSSTTLFLGVWFCVCYIQSVHFVTAAKKPIHQLNTRLKQLKQLMKQLKTFSRFLILLTNLFFLWVCNWRFWFDSPFIPRWLWHCVGLHQNSFALVWKSMRSSKQWQVPLCVPEGSLLSVLSLSGDSRVIPIVIIRLPTYTPMS